MATTPPETILSESHYPKKLFRFTGEWQRELRWNQPSSKVAKRNRKAHWLPIYKADDGEINLMASLAVNTKPIAKG